MLTREDVKKIIPHRDPLLLIDDVLEMEVGKSITARFYISPDRDIFRGHFPADPVFPGVYTIECMAQASDVLLLSLPEYAGKTPLFLGVDKVSFKKKIKPGDELIIKALVIKHNIDKAVVVLESDVYVQDELAASGEVVLAMR